MPPSKDRTVYCRRQAAKCALAATNTALSEIREAYLNMERAWLQLAPGLDGNPVSQNNADKPESGLQRDDG